MPTNRPVSGPHPYIKICCISSLEEAQTAIGLGASALGLVSEMPSGPGVINQSEIASIAGHVAKNAPTSIATFLLTAKQNAEEIIEQHQECGTTTLQLVDKVAIEELKKLRLALPAIKLVQVIHVSGETSIDEALTVQAHVDALLLDSGNQQLSVKELGGTGRTHNWDISARLVERAKVPVFLAGGLHSENVGQAMQRVNPYGLDLCSGVRTNNRLDSEKLKNFMQQALFVGSE